MKLNLWHVLGASIVFLIIGYFTSSSTVEIISAVSGLLCVWLCAKENIWNYPVGFVNIGCFMYIFWGVGLYADFTLQIIFFVLGVFGWVFWLRNRGHRDVRPTTVLTRNQIAYTLIAIVIGTIAWAEANIYFFNNPAIPYFDAFVATLSVIAQVLMSSKKLENWYLWIVVDVLSIGMYWYKDLHLVSILYVFFLINAIYGAYAWHKQYEKEVENYA